MTDLRTSLRNFLQKTHLWKPVHFLVQCTSIGLYKIAKIKLFEIDQKSYWSDRSATPEMDVQNGDPYYQSYDSTIIEEIGQLKQCTTILEVGCFTGKMLSLVQKKFSDKKITGCDLGSDQLLICRQRMNAMDVDLIQCNAAYLPFKKSSFDLVFTSTCLQHIPDEFIEKTIRELTRVGKTHLLLAESYIHHLTVGKKFELLSSNYYYMHDYKKLLNTTPFGTVKVFGITDDSGVNRYSIFVYRKKDEA